MPLGWLIGYSMMLSVGGKPEVLDVRMEAVLSME